MTNPVPLTDAAITYGPTGVRCGCGRDAHSNLSPCHTELAAWITRNLGEIVFDFQEARDQLLAAWELTWAADGSRTMRTHLGWTLACAAKYGPYPTADETAEAIVSTFAPIRRLDVQPNQI